MFSPGTQAAELICGACALSAHDVGDLNRKAEGDGGMSGAGAHGGHSPTMECDKEVSAQRHLEHTAWAFGGTATLTCWMAVLGFMLCARWTLSWETKSWHCVSSHVEHPSPPNLAEGEAALGRVARVLCSAALQRDMCAEREPRSKPCQGSWPGALSGAGGN